MPSAAQELLVDRRRTSRERRHARRAPFTAAVRSAPVTGPVELALAVDLSATGMRLRRCPDPETTQRVVKVKLEFELPDGGGIIVANGELEFEGVDGSFRAAGVRFVELDADARARITRYVAATAS